MVGAAPVHQSIIVIWAFAKKKFVPSYLFRVIVHTVVVVAVDMAAAEATVVGVMAVVVGVMTLCPISEVVFAPLTGPTNVWRNLKRIFTKKIRKLRRVAIGR